MRIFTSSGVYNGHCDLLGNPIPDQRFFFFYFCQYKSTFESHVGNRIDIITTCYIKNGIQQLFAGESGKRGLHPGVCIGLHFGSEEKDIKV
jgi:hypothetical protein